MSAPPLMPPAADTGAAERSFHFGSHEPPAPPLEDRPRWVTWRSVLLGSAAVCLVSTLVPYNDFVVANSNLVGSYLPVVMVLTFFVLIVLINGPLHRFAPRFALRSGELGVIMAMLLATCSIPSQGLMRSFILRA